MPIARSFSYTESQLGRLEIDEIDRLSDLNRDRFERMLSYYAEHYQLWEIDS
jgi:hypothetical protein